MPIKGKTFCGNGHSAQEANPLLQKVISDPHNLIQLLHHAATYIVLPHFSY
jgi:hypothetical protein